MRRLSSLLWLLLVLLILIAALVANRPAAAGDGATPCVDGMAGSYPCENADLLAFMPLSDLGADVDTLGANVWGWTDPEDGTEYVLMGLTNAVAFVDISDPENPVYLGQLPTHTTSAVYRDLKVYNDYAFIVADNPSLHGLQVFDLTDLRDVTTPPVTFTEAAHFDGFGNGHNISINEDTGYAYVARTEQCSGSLYMVNIQDPLNPAFAGCFSEGGLASDSMCVVYNGPDADYHGRELCAIASDDNVLVADVTDKAAAVNLGTMVYNQIERSHNAWWTDDHHYFLTSDMHDELHQGLNTRIFVWDMADVDNPTLVGNYEGPTTGADHNVFIHGNYAYVGNFRAGLRVLEMTDLATATLTEVAYFDVYPADDNPDHGGGAWAVYPYFASEVIALSDKEQGLFLLDVNLTPTSVGVSGLSGDTAGPSWLWWPALLALAAAVFLVLWRRQMTRAGR